MNRHTLLTGCLVFLASLATTSAWSAEVVPPEIEQPGTQPGQISNLESPDKCDNCHGGYNPAVEPAHNWRGSMMANASRDAIFWATLAIAEQDFDGAGDLCIRCHSTAGWLAGRSTPTDGQGLAAGDADGVECDYCHKLTNPDNSEHAGVMFEPFVANEPNAQDDLYDWDDPDGVEGYLGSGMSSIWGGSDKLGPYVDADARHQFMLSEFHRDRDFCGTCHDVSNPAVGELAPNHGAMIHDVVQHGSGAQGDMVAFNNPPYRYGVVERTFSEYKSALIARTKVDDFATLPADLQGGALRQIWEIATDHGTKSADYENPTAPRYYSCQTCHMRPVTGTGANKKGVPVRDDLPLHDMTGGNYWMPDVIQWMDDRGLLRLGGGLTETQRVALADGKLRAEEQLRLAASLTVDEQADTVKIVNHTGHKLISGYPEGRRMWLNVAWYDAAGQLLREDGAYGPLFDADGFPVTVPDDQGNPVQVNTLLDPGTTSVYEAHMGMTRDWVAALQGLLGPDAVLAFEPTRTDPSDSAHVTVGDFLANTEAQEIETFHFVLNNAVLKDNRIPPYGMNRDLAEDRNALPVPADQYGAPGSGGVYDYFDVVALGPPANATGADIRLLYQPTSWEYIQFLWLANDGGNAFLAAEGENLLRAWLATGMAAPFVMAEASWGETGGAGCGATAPTLLSADPAHQSVSLAWQGDPGNPSVDGYRLYYDQVDKSQLVTSLPCGTPDHADCTAHVDTGLTNGQAYCYKVSSYSDSEACESAMSNVLCATPTNEGSVVLVSATQLRTGSWVTTGKGKNQVTTFELSDTFNAGDEIVVAVTVESESGAPVVDATVSFDISGPESLALTSAPSDGDGFADTTWSTRSPNPHNAGGTPPGLYTVTVTGVSVAGYDWDGVPFSLDFTIQ